MKIGDLARAVGVSTDTLRHYERLGLIWSDRRANGYRDFPEAMLPLLRLIREGQGLGFSLTEMAELLQGLGSGLDREAVADILRAKIADLDARSAQIARMRGLLAERLGAVCALGLDEPRRGQRS